VAGSWGGSVELDHPPHVVWDFLTSASNDAGWRAPWVLSVRPLSEGPLAIGTRYETVYRFFGQIQRVVVETTELEPPLRMAWCEVDSRTIVSNVGSYELEAIDGGRRTRFTVTGTFTSRGWRRLIDAPFAWYLRHGPVQQQHAQLAAALAASKDTAA
jgi:hypothetical protein